MQEEGNLALGTLAPSAGKTNSVVVSRGFDARSSAAGMLLPRVFGLRKLHAMMEGVRLSRQGYLSPGEHVTYMSFYMYYYIQNELRG